MEGLTEKEVKLSRLRYGFNEIKQEHTHLSQRIVKIMRSPVSLMLIAAALLSFVIGKVFDCYFILVLFVLNGGIALWQEGKADRAIEKLSEHLRIKTKVLRDGRWQSIEARELLPGDVIELIVGDLVPADVKVMNAKNLSVNESVLTGESLPKDKGRQATLYSGSFIATGWVMARVTAIGAKTNFNKALLAVEKSERKSALEQDILGVSKFLMGASFVAVIILSIVMFFKGQPISDIALLDLTLVIAGVPVAMPVVTGIITSLGVLQLSRKKAIVRRLSTLEDLANVNLLLSDKTGTLTRNEIRIGKIDIYDNYSEHELLTAAYSAAMKDERSTINQAIILKCRDEGLHIAQLNVRSFIPADSERKHATVYVRIAGKDMVVSVGAPQVIEHLCRMNMKTKAKYEKDIKKAAEDGYRVIAVAIGKQETGEHHMILAGLLHITDPLRTEAAQIIHFLGQNGIDVKMLTGDSVAISQRIAGELGLKGLIVKRSDVQWDKLDQETIRKISTFAEILPQDKCRLVEATRHAYTVAVTGDGVNDLPAIEAADVSIAVSNASDALKGAADIVLASSSIEVIRDAIIESRKVFARLYAYSVYRISESFRLVMTIFIIGLMASGFLLTPIQLILIAFLNDLPIISLAFNRVKYAQQPQHIHAKSRLRLSVLFGSIGVLNSIIIYVLAQYVLHLSFPVIQTLFFLKMTVSGHMLIYVAHTKERWWRYLPSRSVIAATSVTQLLATLIAFEGWFMAAISPALIAFIWVWAFFWMQISEVVKVWQQNIESKKLKLTTHQSKAMR